MRPQTPGPSQRVALPALLLLLLLGADAMAGCLDDDGEDEEEVPSSVAAPEWEIGQWWDYYYSIPEEENRGFKLVVATNDGENYWVGADSEHAAEYHAVLNFNPVLGRVDINDFSIYEKGEKQKILDFPLTKGKGWSFALLGIDNFDAKVTKIEKANELVGGKRYPTTLVYVEATGSGAEQLSYIYDSRAGWLRSFQLSDPAGEPLVQIGFGFAYGTGHTGEVHFVRAMDLFDQSYETQDSAEVELDDTFTDSGHPSADDFHWYVYYLQYSTEDGSRGSIRLRDHSGNEGYGKTIGSNQHSDEQGTIEVVSGEWTVQVNLEGTTWLRMRIAGGIYYSWEL